MANDKNGVLALLESAAIKYEVTEHRPIYTVEEGEALKLPHPEAIARTLFLCDDKHHNFWLVTLPKDKKLDLKALRAQLGSRRLTFAAAEELDAMLNLPPGSVTPLGALNDAEGRVPLNGADLALMLMQQGHKVNWLAL